MKLYTTVNSPSKNVCAVRIHKYILLCSPAGGEGGCRRHDGNERSDDRFIDGNVDGDRGHQRPDPTGAGMSDMPDACPGHEVLLPERARAVPQLHDRAVEQELNTPLSHVPIADGHLLGGVVRDDRQNNRDHGHHEAGVHVSEIRLQRAVLRLLHKRARTGVRAQAEHLVSGVFVPMGRRLRSAVQTREPRAPQRLRRNDGKPFYNVYTIIIVSSQWTTELFSLIATVKQLNRILLLIVPRTRNDLLPNLSANTVRQT